MTILSDNEILKEHRDGLIKIQPFFESRLTPAGYDFACNSNIELEPGNHKLISTSETIMLSAQILATIHLKSSLTREGIIGSFAIIDPGFKGNLTLSIFNAGKETVRFKKDEPIVHIIFHRTGTPSSNPYKGKYQNSQGIEKSKRS